MENRRKLDSWKEIASYLNREVRTVQRWEGLPVHRITVRERSRVYAYSDELDEWVRLKSGEGGITAEPAVAGWRRWWWIGLVVAATVSTVAFLYARRGAEPALPSVVHGRLFASLFQGKARPIALPAGAIPFRAIASQDGDILYVGDYQLSAIHVVDVRSGKLLRSISLAARPQAMASAGVDGEVFVSAEQGDLFLIRDQVITKLRQMPGAIGKLPTAGDIENCFLAVPTDGLWVYFAGGKRFERVSAVRCPHSLQLSERQDRLYVFYQCSGPMGRPGHDSIEILDVATHQRKGILQGPPMVGGGFSLTDGDSMLVTVSHTACASKMYDQAGCVTGYPATLHLFQLQDHKHIRSQGVSWACGIDQSVPGSNRIVLRGEKGMEVVDVASGDSTERIPANGSLAFSEVRKEAYLLSEGKVTILDTGANIEPVGRGLTEFWPADGTVGNGKGMYGVEAGTVAQYGRGIAGQAFVLNSGDAVVMTPDHSEPLKSTVSFWVQFPERVGRRDLARRLDSHGHGWVVSTNEDGRVRFTLGKDVVLEGSKVEAGRWHHVSASHGEGAISLWVDGRMVGKMAAPPIPIDGVSNLVLGGNASDVPGILAPLLLDEVTLHNRELSDAELLEYVGRLTKAR